VPDGSFEASWIPEVESKSGHSWSAAIPPQGRSGADRLEAPATASVATDPVATDPVAIAAEARFAELAADAALEAAVNQARQQTEPVSRDATDPLDQVAADWVAQIEADEKIVHAFLGIDDPIAREADDLFTQTAVEAELDALLERLPGSASVDGELAALSAFDDALARGADAEEALLAAESVEDDPAAISPLAPIGIPEPRPILGPAQGVAEAAPNEPDNGTRTTDPLRGTDDRPPPDDPTPPVFVTAGLAGLGPGAAVLADSAFGFGFRFEMPPAPPLETRSREHIEEDRNDPVETAEGSRYNNVIGSAAADFLLGTSGSDAIGGKEGNDYLYGETPSNYDPSSHSVSSPLTNPVFSENGAADILSGGGGDDTLFGGAGADRLHGDVPDTGSALAGDFSFPLGLTADGADYLDGGSGADTLWGGGGDDTLIGGEGNDDLHGEDGADRLYGSSGSDNIFGYAGDDILQSGEGDDEVTGGDGADEFAFAGGSGADALAHAESLGTDTILDYDAAENDVFSLSDADFGFGTTGNLTAGVDYFEASPITLSITPQDLSSGVTGPAIVIMGANTGSDGVAVYYTDNPSQMTETNSYQLADIVSVNASDIEAADFLLRT